MKNSLVMVVAALSVTSAAGCMINGKPLFGGGKGGSEPAASSTPGGTALPAPAGPAPETFAWCKGTERDVRFQGPEKALTLDEEAQYVLPAIVQSLCQPDEDMDGKRGQVEAVRQAWMKRLGMTEADWATDLMTYNAIRFEEREGDTVSVPDETIAWSKLTPVQQYGLLAKDLGEGFTMQGGGKTYIADAVGLSEAGRVAYLLYCLGDESHPSMWAMCQGDLDALDRTKLAAELHALPASDALDKMYVRFGLAKLDRLLPEHTARVKKAIASDPAFAKLFELAAASRAEWKAKAPGFATLLGLVSALDEARISKSRSAAQRCDVDLWPATAQAIGKLPASMFEGIAADPSEGKWYGAIAAQVAVTDPMVNLAVNAISSCAADVPFADFLTAAGASWPTIRGPRTLFIANLLLADLRPDRADVQIDVPAYGVHLAFREQATATRSAMRHPASGVVASVTTKAGKTTVKMPATHRMQEECVRSKRTNRIERIASDGSLVYEDVCTKTTSRRIDTTPGPYTFEEAAGGNVKAGQYVMINESGVEGAWASAGAKRPLAVLGVALKQ